MGDYTEHLITQAGGDGDELDQIQRRDKASDPLCESPCPSEECAAMQDRRYLLAIVREQSAQIERVRELHKPFTWEFGFGPVTSCKGCADQGASERAAEYPCPTITALTATDLP